MSAHASLVPSSVLPRARTPPPSLPPPTHTRALPLSTSSPPPSLQVEGVCSPIVAKVNQGGDQGGFGGMPGGSPGGGGGQPPSNAPNIEEVD